MQNMIMYNADEKKMKKKSVTKGDNSRQKKQPQKRAKFESQHQIKNIICLAADIYV